MAITSSITRAVHILDGNVQLEGDLRMASTPAGLIVFAHGSGSSRHSHRNREVAESLVAGGFATLLLDLLTAHEESIDQFTQQFRFDIARLARRVVAAVDWVADDDDLKHLNIGCFGASTGAAAALIGAAERPEQVAAVVSRGGRPDLAGDALSRVQAPTLLIVGGADVPVIQLNEDAKRLMPALVDLQIVPGATHLFEEPGALEHVSQLALEWFGRHLRRSH